MTNQMPRRHPLHVNVTHVVSLSAKHFAAVQHCSYCAACRQKKKKTARRAWISAQHLPASNCCRLPSVDKSAGEFT